MRGVVQDEALDVAAVGGVALEAGSRRRPAPARSRALGLVASRERRAQLLDPLDWHLQQLGEQARRHRLGRDGEHGLDGGRLGPPLGAGRALTATRSSVVLRRPRSAASGDGAARGPASPVQHERARRRSSACSSSTSPCLYSSRRARKQATTCARGRGTSGELAEASSLPGSGSDRPRSLDVFGDAHLVDEDVGDLDTRHRPLGERPQRRRRASRSGVDAGKQVRLRGPRSARQGRHAGRPNARRPARARRARAAAAEKVLHSTSRASR